MFCISFWLATNSQKNELYSNGQGDSVEMLVLMLHCGMGFERLLSSYV